MTNNTDTLYSDRNIENAAKLGITLVRPPAVQTVQLLTIGTKVRIANGSKTIDGIVAGEARGKYLVYAPEGRYDIPIQHRFEVTGTATPAELAALMPEPMPRVAVGTRVKFTHAKSGDLLGKTGTVVKVNTKTWGIEVDGLGEVRATPSLVTVLEGDDIVAAPVDPSGKTYYADEIGGEITCGALACAGSALHSSISHARKGQTRFAGLRGYSVKMSVNEVLAFRAEFGSVCSCEMFAANA